MLVLGRIKFLRHPINLATRTFLFQDQQDDVAGDPRRSDDPVLHRVGHQAPGHLAAHRQVDLTFTGKVRLGQFN
jgi:hypothetical protein